MIYDKKRHNLKHPQGLAEYKERSDFYIKEGYIVELGIYKHTRSTLQNDSLHLYCELISRELNSAGYSKTEESIIDGEMIQIPFTMQIIKEGLWRKIQMTLCEIESTTKLTSRMINQIIDVITIWLGERGIKVDFPNKDRIINK